MYQQFIIYTPPIPTEHNEVANMFINGLDKDIA